MMMMDDKKVLTKHKILIEQRGKVSITGVKDVISFDEDCVVAETDMGVVVLKGVNLHVSSLNVDNGELNVSGEVDSLTYENSSRSGKSRQSVLGKIFK